MLLEQSNTTKEKPIMSLLLPIKPGLHGHIWIITLYESIQAPSYANYGAIWLEGFLIMYTASQSMIGFSAVTTEQ